MAASSTYTIDNLGNLYNAHGIAVGTYDNINQQCELYDSTPIVCPEIAKTNFNQLTVKSKPTYYWVLLIVFIILVIAAAWFLNKK